MSDRYMQAFPYVDRIQRLRYNQTVTGVENIPKEGPAIIAANHLRAADSLSIPAVIAREVGRKTIFAAKLSYFQGEMHLLGHTFRSPVKWFFEEFTEAIPVDREDPRAFAKLNPAASEVLEAGELFAIHFEGTRSIDGNLYRPRTGMAQIALNTGAPIIPTALTYPERRWHDLRQPSTIDFLEPITVEEYGDMRPHDIGTLVRKRVQERTGQTYKHEYAPILSSQERKALVKQIKRSSK